MAKYILHNKLYDTRKMTLIYSTVNYDIYCTKEEPKSFIKVYTFFGFSNGHTEKITEGEAQNILGKSGCWKIYKKLWGLPEDTSNGGKF